MNNIEQVHWIQRAFIEGGSTMYLIAFIGILALLLIVERTISLGSLVVDKTKFLNQISSMILRGDVRGAVTYCDSVRAPLSNTIRSGLVQVLNRGSDEEVQVAMDASVLRESPRLEGMSGFLGLFGNIAVLSGLFGTIMGMITSFRAVSAADPATKSELLSKGISHALNCTAFGLGVAIISIVAYAYFQLKIQRAETELMESSMTLMNLVASNRSKLKIS